MREPLLGGELAWWSGNANREFEHETGSMFGEHVLNHTVPKSTAISDAGITKQTLYGIERSQFTRATYQRAMDFSTS